MEKGTRKCWYIAAMGAFCFLSPDSHIIHVQGRLPKLRHLKRMEHLRVSYLSIDQNLVRISSVRFKNMMSDKTLSFSKFYACNEVFQFKIQ